MIKNKIISFCVFALLGVAVSAGLVANAQTSGLQQAQDEKAQLQRQLDEIERQIAQYQQELNSIKGQKNTLLNKINQLKKQQSSLGLQIQSTNLQIAELENELNETKAAIDDNIAKSAQLQEQLAQLMRLINERDRYPFLYVVVSKGNLSDAVGEIQYMSEISRSIRQVLAETRQVKEQLDQQTVDLTQQQEQAENMLSIKSLQQQKLADSVSEQNMLLRQTQGREADYQIVISDTQRRAAEIRNRLYDLLGVNKQITFGEAVEIAKWVSGQTGVRAAFLLAILTQESNLGKNVGTCNRPGDPPEKSWRVVMKPDRDQEPFLRITSELGLDPDTTPVSCPMHDSKGNQIGWGGAMGPAQFIPSTWMGYKEKVTAITGKTANPWDIRDAFIAAAIKLKADGAGTVEGEWAAAMRYFSGSTNTRYRFYGDNVVAMAAQYQTDIDALN